MSRVAAVREALTDPLTYQRVVFLLLGSALAIAFGLLDFTLIALAAQEGVSLWLLVPLGTVLVVSPLAVLGLMGATRHVEAVAAESFLGVGFPEGTPGSAMDWPQRWRSFWWFLLHVLIGAVVVTVVVLIPSMPAHPVLTPLVVLAAVLLLLVLGRWMSWLAPRMLGPSATERMRRLEAEAVQLAERNRVAREIHDSVGHALSLVTVQAAAARKVIDRDPRFVAEALDAIERASRTAAGDLDHMLGVLRDDGADGRPTQPVPDLRGVGQLVEATRRTGFDVDSEVAADVSGLPLLVSREAYRIVQEGLTNAVRYAAGGPIVLRIDSTEAELRIEVTNPLGPGRQGRPGRRGRGLRGIEERTTTLRGSVTAGEDGGVWRLAVTLPIT